MFKRANKITALLVAAVSVMSIVPAMAADSAKRLGTKDGTITNAVAFKDGRYLFEGYKSDDDDAGLYYNNGSKDKLLDDATEFVSTTEAGVVFSGDTNYEETTIKYGDKYAMVADGSDKYVVDLSNGKISDEDTQSDLMDNVQTKLKSKLYKTDRYKNLAVSETDLKNKLEIGKVDNNNFGDTWYEYKVTSGSQIYYGFTTDGSKYIDASNLANISIYVNDNNNGNGTVKGKVVKVEEFEKEKNGVKVKLNNIRYLAQDKDSIYVLADVTATGTGFTTEPAHRYFVQKLSKAQGDKKDDAYIPKNVTSYELDNNSSTLSIFNNSDAHDAYASLIGQNGIVEHVSVIAGSLYVTVLNGSEDNIKVEKLDLKKDKIDLTANYDTDKTKNVDVYIVKKDDDSDQDIATGIQGWSVDVDGYTWVINEGKIYKFDKLEKKVMYTCDRSLDSIDVYDENSLIAWDHNGDVYTNVAEGKAETSSEAPPVTVTPSKIGWDKLADGTWNFYDAIGTKISGKWINVGGYWYYLKADGAMATGWVNDNGIWYYLDPVLGGQQGAMKTGWINDNGTWYYTNSSGVMKTGWINDNGTWYYTNSSGAMQTGWINVEGKWYYLNPVSGGPLGSMLANTTVNGYVLGSNGAMI